MLFWKKEKGKNIWIDLNNIKKKIKNLKILEKKKDFLITALNDILGNIDSVETEILEKAEEEKAKPWIKTDQDPKVDALASTEITELNKLKLDIEGYKKEIEMSELTEEQVELCIDILDAEADEIVKRNKEYKTVIDNLARETIKERIRNSAHSFNLTGKTSDKVKFSDIATVARELGGKIEKGGRHPYEIKFDNSSRPIPLSFDVKSKVIAKEITQQLAYSMPSKKIPKKELLEEAFAKGSLLAVAA